MNYTMLQSLVQHKTYQLELLLRILRESDNFYNEVPKALINDLLVSYPGILHNLVYGDTMSGTYYVYDVSENRDLLLTTHEACRTLLK